MSYSLAVDIGGTFTDVVLRRDDGVLTVDKTLTTHDDLLAGFFRCIGLVLDKADVAPDAVTGVVVHATTVVTNALIERNGARAALIVTKGFRDVLSIRNEHRYEMYDPQIEFADPLVPRELTFEIDERVLADGACLRGVDAAEARSLAATLRAAGVESVAICLLNSFRDGRNEQAWRGCWPTSCPTSACRSRRRSRRRSANIPARRRPRSMPIRRRSPNPICTGLRPGSPSARSGRGRSLC